MKKRQIEIQIASLVLAMLVASIPSAAQAGGTKDQNAAPAAESESKTAAREQSSGAPHEGIKVHGHWTIVVRNADGSVASRHEFENSLVSGGGDLALAEILGRFVAIVGPWAVDFGGIACDSSGAQCFVAETAFQSNVPNQPLVFRNLVLQAPNVGTNAQPQYGIALSGTAKFSVPNNIATVRTFISVCSPGSNACPPTVGGLYVHNVTARSLATPIAVQAGQSVDVTVILTFS